jgi:hypothetical protein
LINCKDIQRLEGLSFEDYLKLPFYSNSYLKAEVGGVTPEFIPTSKVNKGKLLDAMICNEIIKSFEHFNEIKWLYFHLQKTYGWLKIAKTQVSYTGTFCYENFEMPFKGRLDLELPNAVIDLKYTEEKRSNFRNLIEHMGYINQVWAYAKISNKPKAYILMVNKKCESELIEIPLSERNYFYEEKILKFGNIN